MAVIKGTFSNDSLNGQSGNDRLYGQSGNDSLVGRHGNDSLVGAYGNDDLVGAYGNDNLVGGAGNDYLNGAGIVYDSLGPQSFGQGEIDTLTGGTGMDTFQLWGGSGRAGVNVYYDSNLKTAGLSDYALITDFNPNEDIIALTRVQGFGQTVPVNYVLGASPDGSRTGIFIDKPNTQADELIAVLQGVPQGTLNLNGSYFSYFG
jgi:Ca2+-binding RTX toxin-like protein